MKYFGIAAIIGAALPIVLTGAEFEKMVFLLGVIYGVAAQWVASRAT